MSVDRCVWDTHIYLQMFFSRLKLNIEKNILKSYQINNRWLNFLWQIAINFVTFRTFLFYQY